jgi:hypothetical protein
MYTTLEQVKQFLRITDSTDDALIESLILSTKAQLDKLIGDMVEGNRSFFVTFCEMKDKHIRLLTRNIIELVSIDGTAYTGILGTDYVILPPYNSLMYVKDLFDYLDSDTPYHTIEVVS